MFLFKGASTDSTSLTITGTGFDEEPSNNTVTIGDTNCEVTTTTSTELECDIGDGPAWSHQVHLRVHGKGYADHIAMDFMFSYDFSLDAITPSSGSTKGIFYEHEM